MGCMYKVKATVERYVLTLKVEDKDDEYKARLEIESVFNVQMTGELLLSFLKNILKEKSTDVVALIEKSDLDKGS